MTGFVAPGTWTGRVGHPIKNPRTPYLSAVLRNWRNQVRLIAKFAAEPCVALSPRFEVARDGVEELRLRHRPFLNRGAVVKRGTQPGVPADDRMPVSHLILEETSQQQALRPRGFEHHGVRPQGVIAHEVIEDRRRSSRGPAFRCRSALRPGRSGAPSTLAL